MNYTKWKLLWQQCNARANEALDNRNEKAAARYIVLLGYIFGRQLAILKRTTE